MGQAQEKSWWGRLSAPFLAIWHLVPVHWQGYITLALPAAALLATFVIAYNGNRHRAVIESDVQRKLKITRALGDVLTLMVNAETGMRGYELTRREEFLQPYDTAQRELPPAMQHLQELAQAEPRATPRFLKLQRIESLQRSINAQMADLAAQKALVPPAPQPYLYTADYDRLLYERIVYGKGIMDNIRAELERMQTAEETLLADRIEEINRIRRRDYLSIYIALAIGLVMRVLSWYLFRKGVLERVGQLVENVRAWRQNEPLPHDLPGKNDPLGELEAELAHAHKIVANKPSPAR